MASTAWMDGYNGRLLGSCALDACECERGSLEECEWVLGWLMARFEQEGRDWPTYEEYYGTSEAEEANV